LIKINHLDGLVSPYNPLPVFRVAEVLLFLTVLLSLHNCFFGTLFMPSSELLRLTKGDATHVRLNFTLYISK